MQPREPNRPFIRDLFSILFLFALLLIVDIASHKKIELATVIVALVASALAVLLGSAFRSQRSARSNMRPYRGPDVSGLQAPSDAVLRLIDASRMIEAIKVYREQTGVGLKDAKDVIEKTRADRRKT